MYRKRVIKEIVFDYVDSHRDFLETVDNVRVVYSDGTEIYDAVCRDVYVDWPEEGMVQYSIQGLQDDGDDKNARFKGRYSVEKGKCIISPEIGPRLKSEGSRYDSDISNDSRESSHRSFQPYSSAGYSGKNTIQSQSLVEVPTYNGYETVKETIRKIEISFGTGCICTEKLGPKKLDEISKKRLANIDITIRLMAKIFDHMMAEEKNSPKQLIQGTLGALDSTIWTGSKISAFMNNSGSKLGFRIAKENMNSREQKEQVKFLMVVMELTIDRIANAPVGDRGPMYLANTVNGLAEFGFSREHTLQIKKDYGSLTGQLASRFLETVLRYMVNNLEYFKPIEIANTVNGLAQIGFRFSDILKTKGGEKLTSDLLHSVTHHLAYHLGNFKPIEIANTVNGLAQIGFRFSDILKTEGGEKLALDLLHSVAVRLAHHSGNFESQHIANTVNGLAQIGDGKKR
ncbi:MAG: hypothetical protein LBI29_03835 [Rickettsiales bacterium]|jgi:hypothetical protein|nr:hypothetical protein [Rickettsiales bacterium]